MFLDYELRARWGKFKYAKIYDIHSDYLRWALTRAKRDRRARLFCRDDVSRIRAELFRRANTFKEAA